ncbi:hypothetical protein BDDG_11743 [Blastomyces dermatitidis ATCC 18188]|uniref:Uncharacterized protein n=1 Tax=Ajellomyces dermatitidis (strain ATCC 18188 / CBS 674.68) TaxID=653446 RepID=A0A0J9ENH5_AJEDA|nr:hypothetical protein BDDG_11743 [Blastomyces dermatitidis ATCC 18188]
MSTEEYPEDKDDMSDDGMEFEKFFDGLRSNLPTYFFGSRHGRLLQKRMKVEANHSCEDQRALFVEPNGEEEILHREVWVGGNPKEVQEA